MPRKMTWKAMVKIETSISTYTPIKYEIEHSPKAKAEMKNKIEIKQINPGSTEIEKVIKELFLESTDVSNSKSVSYASSEGIPLIFL